MTLSAAAQARLPTVKRTKNRMQRRAFYLAFTLAFTGVLALGTGWTTPVETEAASPTPQPTHVWIVLPTNPPDSSFGELMPDGTHCGVLCPEEP